MIARLRTEFSNWLLRPPYDGVIMLAWLYVVFASYMAGGGPFNGDLVWFDDRVRLVQIFDWLNGQGWYDRTIMRVNAPEGFHTIWSRVVDLPVAGIIALFQHSLGQMHAAMVASTIMPLIQTLFLFFAARYFAAPLVGAPQAALVTLFVVFSSCINPEPFTLAGFQIGMVGHHGWYVLLTLCLFGSVARLMRTSDRRAIIYGGFSIAGLLVIGIEGLPLMAGAFAITAFIGWLQNRSVLALDMLKLTGIGSLLGFLLVPANQPPDHWFSISFAEPSILGPLLIAIAAIFFAGQYFILRQYGGRKTLSFALSAMLAGTIAALLLHFFPEFLNGGAAALTPEERALATAEHLEAQSIFHVAQNNIDLLRMMVPPLLAVACAYFQLRTTRQKNEQALAIFYLGLLVLCFTMASLYSRYFHYLGLTTIPWLMLLLQNAAKHIKPDQYRALKIFALYFAIGPLWYWLVPAANYDLKFVNGVLLYPAKVQAENDACETRGITDFIRQHYSADKKIMVPMYHSDRFLLHTPLQIFFLANFPSNNKFMEAKQFYETRKSDEAREIIQRNHIDLVAVCTQAYHISAQSTATNLLMRGHMNFGQLLVTGQAPAWLRQAPINTDTPWLLFAVN